MPQMGQTLLEGQANFSSFLSDDGMLCPFHMVMGLLSSAWHFSNGSQKSQSFAQWDMIKTQKKKKKAETGMVFHCSFNTGDSIYH